VTTDIYANAGDDNVQSGAWARFMASPVTDEFSLLQKSAIPDPGLLASQDIPWRYWAACAGNYIEDGNYKSRQFLYDVYSDSHVVPLDGATKLGAWKNT
jgi:hypothetical protein